MVGAMGAMYTAVWTGVARQPAWWGIAVVLAAAVMVCCVLGFAIERLAYRPLRNQPRITALITAIGVSLLLQYGGQIAFGATPQAFPALVPPTGEAPTIGRIVIDRVDIIIFGLTIALMLLLSWIILKTRTGMALRAVSFRFDTSSLMGINTDRIIAITFVIGSALAAIGGVLYGIKYRQVWPLMGLMPGLKAFIAAVLGGIGSVPGAVLGALVLGLTEIMVVAYVDGGSQYRDGVAFVILIVILLVKPSGLLGKNVIEKV